MPLGQKSDISSLFPSYCQLSYTPPEVERTLTVGREAIVEDSLEVLTAPKPGRGCVYPEN